MASISHTTESSWHAEISEDRYSTIFPSPPSPFSLLFFRSLFILPRVPSPLIIPARPPRCYSSPSRRFASSILISFFFFSFLLFFSLFLSFLLSFSSLFFSFLLFHLKVLVWSLAEHKPVHSIRLGLPVRSISWRLSSSLPPTRTPIIIGLMDGSMYLSVSLRLVIVLLTRKILVDTGGDRRGQGGRRREGRGGEGEDGGREERREGRREGGTTDSFAERWRDESGVGIRC